MKKRIFSEEYKTSLVLEVLQGEQELNQIATNCYIAPNQLMSWKSEFMKKAVRVFDEKRDKKIIKELQEKTEENERLYKKSVSSLQRWTGSKKDTELRSNRR